MESTLVKFVKGVDLNPIGCVVASKVDSNGVVYVTGSTCRVGKDVFQKAKGVDIALRRVDTMALGKRKCPLHQRMAPALAEMEARARRYFKDAKGFVVSPVKM